MSVSGQSRGRLAEGVDCWEDTGLEACKMPLREMSVSSQKPGSAREGVDCWETLAWKRVRCPFER